MKSILLRLMRKGLAIAFGIFLALVMIFSLPALKFWLEKAKKNEEIRKVPVPMVKTDLKPKESKKDPRQTPKRSTSTQRNVKSGPQFGVDLGVMGATGVALPAALGVPSGGGSALGAPSGDVDQRPEQRGSYAFELPRKLRESEANAYVATRFCVDVGGRPNNIQILEERPGGAGLSQAAQAAIGKASFTPAQKDGKAVPFCFVEQEFEVRFND